MKDACYTIMLCLEVGTSGAAGKIIVTERF
jgi:hypothetical protein